MKRKSDCTSAHVGFYDTNYNGGALSMRYIL